MSQGLSFGLTGDFPPSPGLENKKSKSELKQFLTDVCF